MYWEADPTVPGRTRVVDIVRDDHLLVEKFLSTINGTEFPYLRFISLETVTIFHQRHLSQLVAELVKSSEGVGDPQLAVQLRAMSQFVFAALGAEDTLIAFRVRAA
jgi:hypothetical protein